MSIEIKVPQLPESVSDATLVAWHKKVGESVARDENLVDLETDKVVLEVPAPASGILQEIKIKNGTTVTAGDVLAVLKEGEGEAAAPTSKASKPAAAGKQDAAGDDDDDDDDDETDTGKSTGSAHKLSPSVRRMLEEHDIEASAISGTGKDGRVTKSDVMKYLQAHGEDARSAEEGSTKPAAASAAPAASRSEQRVPMTRLRARIAERLVTAQQTAAMLTTFNEVDLTEVMALRSRYKEQFEKEHGVKLGFMSFFAKAAVEALKKFPAVNASVEGNDIIYHNYFDIGVAVSSDRGLMVPVVRDVDHMSFADVEASIAELGRKAREGAISMEDLTGGTFTITNGGIFGSMLSTPILNPPQSAILGMHAIMQRPMAVDGEVKIRPMMYLALTYDHRIIDGKEAVQFLVSIKQSLEDPGRLLLRV